MESAGTVTVTGKRVIVLGKEEVGEILCSTRCLETKATRSVNLGDKSVEHIHSGLETK